MKTTTMQFTETELEFIASFLTFSYIKSRAPQSDEEAKTDDELVGMIARFKSAEAKLNNY